MSSDAPMPGKVSFVDVAVILVNGTEGIFDREGVAMAVSKSGSDTMVANDATN